MPTECGLSQDKLGVSTDDVSCSPSLNPERDVTRQRNDEKARWDQVGGEEHAQFEDACHVPPSNVPGTSDPSSGEKKSAQTNKRSAKPSKHREKTRSSKHPKKTGRSIEQRSNAAKETKDEASTVPTPRDQNTAVREDAPLGTVDKCHERNLRHLPQAVPSSLRQQEEANVVKSDTTVDGTVGSTDQQQSAGTDATCGPPTVDLEATTWSVIEEPIYYESFKTITNERGSPIAEEIIGGFVPGTDTTLLGFPTYITDAEKSPRSSNARTPRYCTII
ncbi:uncharacterized protein LOC142813944 [Rhipicephalus microplus]|uniref:uncharacterized protein LOC142813944 n=1 Tax=Rhipicephalus microplus TaxID=6941 RepID=UPI003F6D35B7